MSLKDKVKKYDQKYGSGNFLKLEDGQNQLRILTEPELYDDVINGEPGGSFIAYVLVRNPEDGDSMALLNLSKVVIRWLADEEAAGKFTGYPMPYDIIIFKQTSGKKTSYVSVPVDPANSPAITPPQMAALNSAKPITEVAQMLAKKKAGALPAADHAALPSPSAVVEQAMIQKKNRAEVNNMFIAISNSVNNATDEVSLDKAAGMVTMCVTGGSLNDFEAGLLTDLISKKRSDITGAPAVDEAINVEGIPF